MLQCGNEVNGESESAIVSTAESFTDSDQTAISGSVVLVQCWSGRNMQRARVECPCSMLQTVCIILVGTMAFPF